MGCNTYAILCALFISFTYVAGGIIMKYRHEKPHVERLKVAVFEGAQYINMLRGESPPSENDTKKPESVSFNTFTTIALAGVPISYYFTKYDLVHAANVGDGVGVETRLSLSSLSTNSSFTLVQVKIAYDLDTKTLIIRHERSFALIIVVVLCGTIIFGLIFYGGYWAIYYLLRMFAFLGRSASRIVRQHWQHL